MPERAVGHALAVLRITGEPQTKKTSGRIIFPQLRTHRGLKGYLEHLLALARRDAVTTLLQELRWAADKVRPIVLPSRDFELASRSAVKELRALWGSRDPLAVAVQVTARYFIGPRRAPDLQGLFEATADLLEKAGIIDNDYWIVSWDGSRRERDPEDPRTELVLSEVEGVRPKRKKSRPRPKSTSITRCNALSGDNVERSG